MKRRTDREVREYFGCTGIVADMACDLLELRKQVRDTCGEFRHLRKREPGECYQPGGHMVAVQHNKLLDALQKLLRCVEDDGA
jgi:hypothetical protein